MDVVLIRRQLAMAALETTYGVDANPTHTASYQALRLMEPFNLDLGQEIVDVSGGNLSRGFGRPIGTVRPAGVSFKMYVQGLDSGSYTANRKPPIGDLLRSCGMQETLVTSNSNGQPEYQYAPTLDVSSDNSVTFVAHQDGYEHRLLGARGNFNLVFGAAAPVVVEFTFRGILSTEAATTRTGNPTLPTQIPPRWIGSGSIYVQSLQINVENLNFNSNYTVLEERASTATSGSGIVQVLLTDRQPGGSFDPEATLPGSYDAFGIWRSTSGGALSLQVGNTQSNRFTLVASQMVFRKVAWGNKQGLGIFNIDYQTTELNGADEMLWRFN